MEKLPSIDALLMLQKRLKSQSKPDLPTIVIPAGTCGQASGANDLIRVAKREILERGLSQRVKLRITGCHGFCELEPSVLIEPKGTFYPKVTMEGMARIVEAVARGDVLKDLLTKDPASGQVYETQNEIPFFRSQRRDILARNEGVDPIRINQYIEHDGYGALTKVLSSGKPEAVIEDMKASGLRGRGGAGFPTGAKWALLAHQPDGTGKYLVCNADEGDPGAYMDRSVLEGNPHSVIEGMLIGAFATGASQGIIYVRMEYPLAIKHLLIALKQARELGLLGTNILGTGFSFDIQMVKGAGAFVCGEETALIRSVEGNMGEPRQRPPYPIAKGIFGKPTAINNVETWANVPIIIARSGSEYAKTGTPNNTGTKIFSLVGKIKNTGLVEVPMGITLEKIVNDIGGGPSGHAPIKAVQTGGPSGGCIPAHRFNLPVDYDSLAQAGSIMGSGGMIVMDENTCMVDVAKYFMKFLKDESCGKCFTCRKGTQRMYEILEDISEGRGTLAHLDLLQELAEVVRDTSMCALGQSAPNPVLSTLRYFREEYKRHVVQQKCDAFVCKDLVGAPCATACPIGTEAWRYIAHIAKGEYEKAYTVIREANPFPSVCARVCSHPCESRCKSGTLGGDPIAIRALKRFITDQIDPSVYQPKRQIRPGKDIPRVAVIGSGPAGLTAAHYLSLQGYKVTVFEADDRPGGMLISGIPSYRLPRETLKKEIECLLDENITVKCNTRLGQDITVEGLFKDGFKAVFLGMGAHKSRRLNVEGEDLEGVYPAIQFLKAFNLEGKKIAKGKVGVIGGGDSAVDAARVALRQPGVESVTIYYRRTRNEMPALSEEVEAAIHEGIKLEPLTSPTRILSLQGRLAGIECIKNKLGELDARGRRHPVSMPGTEFKIELDTLIVTIGDVPDIDYVSDMGIMVSEGGTLVADPDTLATTKPGVFAGGDVVTGPNTVVEAIAAGKRAARAIDRYLRGETMGPVSERRMPKVYVEPEMLSETEMTETARSRPPTLTVDQRQRSFDEVEKTLSKEDAMREAKRCLRCDLEFTRPRVEEPMTMQREKTVQ
ncbi:MAG: FAD-dependent oxidoreductase [Calditrichota bacterium]